MILIKRNFLLQLFVAFLIASCNLSIHEAQSPSPSQLEATVASRKETAFKEIFPFEEMNTFIKFWPEPDFIAADYFLSLSLENTSNARIVFPPDFGIRILTYESEKGWEEIRNLEQYFPPTNRQVSPKGPENPGVIGIGLTPALIGYELPVNIRVVVVGHTEVALDETPESVGAYIDLIVGR